MKLKVLIGLAAAAAAAVLAYVALERFSPTRSATIGEILASNGFTEFKPPSQHVFPGTLVLVTGNDPVALSVICRPLQALGLDIARIPESPSISTDLSAALDRTLNLDAQLLSRLKASGSLADVKDVQIRLRNVRLLELSDDEVISGLPDRSEACKQALELRLTSNQPVTMIKSALIADVTYTATTSVDATGGANVDLQDELAASLNSKVTGADRGKIELAGENLIWGIRDDQVLARLGTSIPPTGTESDVRRILPAGAVVEGLELDDQTRLDVPTGPRRVACDGKPIAQLGSVDCRAAARDKVDLRWQILRL